MSDETYFCDVCDTPIPSGAESAGEVVCRGCGRLLRRRPEVEQTSTRRPGDENLEVVAKVGPVTIAQTTDEDRKARIARILAEDRDPADYLPCPVCAAEPFTSHRQWCDSNGGWGKRAAVNRSTDIQSKSDLIEQRADAIKATAQRVLESIGNYYGEGIPAHEVASLEARLEGIVGEAMHIAGEVGIIRSADAYHQTRAAAPAPKPLVTVIIEDGLVQEVQSDAALELFVIDLDTDGAEDAEAIPAPYVHDDQENEWSAAYVTRWSPDIKPVPAGVLAALHERFIR